MLGGGKNARSNRLDRQLLEHETAGDPMSHLQWARKSPVKIAEQTPAARYLGQSQRDKPVALQRGLVLARQSQDPQVSNKNPSLRKVRNQQFHYICRKREDFFRPQQSRHQRRYQEKRIDWLF